MARGAGWKLLIATVAPELLLVGCGGYESAYERAVYDHEPVYCYRTIADTDCFRAPDPRAARRLVNYYGPSPRRAELPDDIEIRLDPPPAAELDPEEGLAGERSACGPLAGAGECGGTVAPSASTAADGGPLELSAPKQRGVGEGRG